MLGSESEIANDIECSEDDGKICFKVASMIIFLVD